jgi:hypothetical protein
MPYFGIPIRNGLPIGLGSVAGFGVQQFSPADLFSAGEQGAWYDPSDLSTLFDDSAGTTPVTAVEQFVGLMLDKSKGLVLGSELVTNGDFSSGTTGWTADSSTLSVVSNRLNVATTAFNQGASQAITFAANKTYRVSLDVIYSGTDYAVLLGNAFGQGQVYQSGQLATSRTVTFYVTPGAGAKTLSLFSYAGGNVQYDNISVRELPGNHATQTASAKRPKLAARYNLLTYTEQFDNGAWTKLGATVTQNAAVAPNNTLTADKLIEQAATSRHGCYFSTGTLSAISYTFSVYAKAGERDWVIVWLSSSNERWAYFDLANGVVGNVQANTSANIISVGNGWYKCEITCTPTASGANAFCSVSDADYNNPYATYAGDITKGIYIWGADLRPASQATGLIGPTYQRVVDAATYDAVGFLPYLQFDGLSWSMGTGSIDFTATDKMTVWAGVRKLSDAAGYQVYSELGNWNTNVNGFSLGGSSGGNPVYNAGLLNTSGLFPGNSYITYTSPITNVLQYNFDRAQATIATEVVGRINGTNVTGLPYSSPFATASNFGNLPLFIGANNNASFFFNGWLTSLIVRGAQSTQSQIEATESWVAGKTGVSL